jgi:thymidylate synthase
MILDSNIKNIFDFSYESYNLMDYNAEAHIPAKIAI